MAASLNSMHFGCAQGWYGDAGWNDLTLLLVIAFTYNDRKQNGTFSLLGVNIAKTTLAASLSPSLMALVISRLAVEWPVLYP